MEWFELGVGCVILFLCNTDVNCVPDKIPFSPEATRPNTVDDEIICIHRRGEAIHCNECHMQITREEN